MKTHHVFSSPISDPLIRYPFMASITQNIKKFLKHSAFTQNTKYCIQREISVIKLFSLPNVIVELQSYNRLSWLNLTIYITWSIKSFERKTPLDFKDCIQVLEELELLMMQKMVLTPSYEIEQK